MHRTEVVIDTETLGLDEDIHPIWEIAVITRDIEGRDTEHLWQIRPTDEELLRAQPMALEVNRYRERMQVPPWAIALDMLHPEGPSPIEPAELDHILTGILTGAVLLGSNPDFDARFLRARLGSRLWHYRTIDVPTMAAGFLYGKANSESRTLSARTRSPYVTARQHAAGWSAYRLSKAAGTEPPSRSAGHTALGDARWIRDLYDTITSPPGFPTTQRTRPRLTSPRRSRMRPEPSTHHESTNQAPIFRS
ncbi:hypothetical protein ACFC1B_07325 [Streptomyces xiamenensis]|uniref:3'-5' exonuclease n=1 Tax=Streptomyces xiamenensis TaxID=408015 RepID=UPI0035D692F4